jgi:hypothetical protein
MQTYRNDPESQQNQEASKQAERERFALQMQHQKEQENYSEIPNSSEGE